MTKILMATPDYFDVQHASNPHTRGPDGRLHQVDKAKAAQQWQALKATFEGLGIDVQVIQAGSRLPDMVFSSNHGLPLPPFGSKRFLLARMAAKERREEVALFAQWYRSYGWTVEDAIEQKYVLDGEVFEGMGDAAFRPNSTEIWAGCGPRTDAAVWQRIGERLKLKLQLVQLRDPLFYHLDTCFAILDHRTVAYYPDAVDATSRKKIESAFEQIIVISSDDATKRFAGNCWCPDGKHVVVEQGSTQFEADLTHLGFVPVPVDTSEFIKAGGSVYCLKMILEP